MPEIDFEAEGLLEGTEGDAREGRLALLRELQADGVTMEELREATAAGRLALLPVERALAGEGPRYTAREVAERAGLDLSVLRRSLAAVGLPDPGPDARVLGEADLEAAMRVKMFLDLGLPEDGMLEVARAIGISMARIAQANRELILSALAQPGDTERDLALRFVGAARDMVPMVGPTLAYSLQIQLLEQIRRDVIGLAELEAGQVGASEVSVCFADMVGFTKLGERIEIEELTGIAARLEELAADAVKPPVRLVKLIGDAAMLVSPDAEALLDSALALVEAADQQGEEFLRLRAGVARGPTLGRGGDFYGRPVNLASRVTGIARPGSVLAAQEATDAVREAFAFSFAGERRLKGIDGRVRLFRVRRLPASS